MTALERRRPFTEVPPRSLGGAAAGPEPAAPTWLALAPRGRLRGLDGTDAAIESTASGREFIRRLHEARPRVAIVVAPPAGSSELLAAVSERRQRATLRIVLLNPDSGVDERLDALALGFDDALPMSISSDELVGRIHLMLGAWHPPHVEPRQSDIAPGIQLDLAARRVLREGRDVHLRPKEFALLALLASDPGRVYTRDELVDLVWGTRYRGNLRTVDVHVRWLRAKLETDPAHPRHVITVRGTGYRLDPVAS